MLDDSKIELLSAIQIQIMDSIERSGQAFRLESLEVDWMSVEDGPSGLDVVAVPTLKIKFFDK